MYQTQKNHQLVNEIYTDIQFLSCLSNVFASHTRKTIVGLHVVVVVIVTTTTTTTIIIPGRCL